jgi:hypothetical protein
MVNHFAATLAETISQQEEPVLQGKRLNRQLRPVRRLALMMNILGGRAFLLSRSSITLLSGFVAHHSTVIAGVILSASALGLVMPHDGPPGISLSVISLHFRTEPHMTPALAEVHGVTWRARGINPAHFIIHFIIHFFFFIPYGLMASQQASDLAVNAYDDSCIVVANSRREQPADNTCRPIKAPDPSRGYRFRPLKLPIRAPKITALPQEPLLLFQKFVPISLVESWACYTNSWASHVLEEARCGRRTLKPQSRLFQWKSTSAAEIYI